ncbi:MAG: cytochrome ubiquinol oxidase subunit I, partial [Actinomycetota bacterium]|nr:cytochrome ubiquinol oxidase subunit I [Actinomycetota bacterium]
MTATEPRSDPPAPTPVRLYRAPRPGKGSRLAHMLRTTDPKDIAILYLVTSFAFFMAGGAMALLMRAELARPELQFLSTEQF